MSQTDDKRDALTDFLSLTEDDLKQERRDPKPSYKSIADARFTKRPKIEYEEKDGTMDGRYIKHMAFAVKDAHAALKTYQDFLGVALMGV